MESAKAHDHLFMSYAGEDWPFAEWLALRLTAEGYKVWCDRLKLLGGESYPKDIDEAIKNRTFRLLGVLSRHSVQKPNPLKERTLALNLARERNENFLIPLNLDGLSPTDLGWMVSDLTFISFHLSWAEGLAQLLKLLGASNAPRDFANGRSAAAGWFEAKGLVIPKEERLWANVAEIVELPADIYRYEMEANISDEQRLELLKVWPHFVERREIFWSFVYPPGDVRERYRLTERGRITDWKSARSKDISVRQVAVRLFNDSLKSICLARGLKLTPDGSLCYFPDALLPNNWLSFQSYDSKRTRLRTVGVRTFRKLMGKESCRYHLAPYTRVWLDHEIGNLVQMRVRLFLTTLENVPLDEKAALRRRKSICRAWWNYEWLSRGLAILQFLAGEAPTIQIGQTDSQKMTISKKPLPVGIGWGLDEAQLEPTRPESEEADETILELGEGDEEEKEGHADE
jgi:hypothetical protein